MKIKTWISSSFWCAVFYGWCYLLFLFFVCFWFALVFFCLSCVKTYVLSVVGRLKNLNPELSSIVLYQAVAAMVKFWTRARQQRKHFVVWNAKWLFRIFRHLRAAETRLKPQQTKMIELKWIEVMEVMSCHISHFITNHHHIIGFFVAFWHLLFFADLMVLEATAFHQFLGLHTLFVAKGSLLSASIESDWTSTVVSTTAILNHPQVSRKCHKWLV